VITKDHHFELLPDANATDGAAFGIGLEVGLDENGFAPGSSDWIAEEGMNSRDGTTHFGREVLAGPTWSWQLHVNRDDESGALATLRSFRTAWHWLHGRQEPGKVTALRFQLNGERRRIYGRPRRFEAPPDNKILSGYVPVSVDFKCSTPFVYDDEEKEVSLLLGQDLEDEGVDTGGGFIFPVTFPVDLLPATRRNEFLQVGGDAPTYPVIRFYGPVTNPGIVTDDWTLSLTGNGGLTIPDGQYVEVDLRPWARTALLNGTTSVAGYIGPRQRLNKIVFEPGRFEARYIGYSPSSSTCSIRWAPAWNSY